MDTTAYLLTAAALLLWSTLALAASILSGCPPLVTTGLGLLIGSTLSMHRWREWDVNQPTRIVGVGGILGYHLLFFAAFRHAPAVSVNIINYLWPLLMVIGAPFILPKISWSWRHSVAALCGFAGTVAVFGGQVPEAGHWWGYGYAAAAAVTWAAYSLLTKRMKPFSTSAVGGFCFVAGCTALIIAAIRGDLMPTVTHLSLWNWALIVAMGVGPLGIAFFCWDAAIKRGDPRVIGTLSYATPLLSTLWLVWYDKQRDWGWHIAIALACICVGAALGLREPIDNTNRRTTRRTTKKAPTRNL